MLLTIPTTPEKGEFQTYTLDVSDLIALVTEEYYQDQENWRRVIVAYKSLEGNQLNLLSFTPDGGDTLTKQGYFAPESFSFFGIQSISIIDKQNGTYILTSSEIPDVASYNVIFVSAGSAFFDMAANYGAWMDISSDEQFIAVQSNYNSWYKAKNYYNIVMNNTSSEVNDNLTALVNSFKVDCYFFNTDESIVYIAGKLGTNYLGETLPPIPVGSTYSANPPRLISINTTTLEVTYITTIQDSGIYSGFAGSSGTYVNTMIIDEVNNMAVMTGGGAVVGYNIVSGDNIWYKTATFANGNVISRKLELYTSGSFLIGSLSAYDGTSYTFFTPIKINILTGGRDLSFPSAPKDGATVNSINWALSPDKSKVVQQAGNQQAKFYVFSGSSWSSRIDYSGGNVTTPVMAIDNTHLYFLNLSGLKCDYDGLAVAGFSLTVPFFYSFNNCIVAGANLYADFGKFSSSTGARDTNYSMGGQYYLARYSQNDSVYYMISDLFLGQGRFQYPMGYNYAESYYGGYIGIINTTSREKINQFAGAGNNPTLSYGPVFGLDGTNILFNGNGSAVSFSAYNYLTGVKDTTYPKINSITNGIANYRKDGNFIYVASQIYADTANTFNLTDLSGTFNLVTKLIRFNLTTKLVDQTFIPDIPSPFVGSVAISFTDDYVYLCAYYTGTANFCRVNKVTQTVEVITPATLGISSPATWNDAVRIRVSKIATNKIVIYPDSSNLKFDNKHYVICSEDTLSQVGSQPATISEFPRYYAYNTVSGELGGIFFASDNSWYFNVFNLTDNTKATNIIVANESNSPLANSTGSAFNQGNMVMMPFNDAYVTFSTGYYISSFKPYTGVIRMNPLGIINNE